MMAVFPFQDHRFTTGSAPPPAQILTDVRRTPTFGGDEWMIVGAIRGPPDAIAELGTTLPEGPPGHCLLRAQPQPRGMAL
jgi:hypothetical protein